jgi:CrcB protein
VTNLEIVACIIGAGAVGALGRTYLNDAIAHRVATDFPIGILTVNVSGSFVLGLVTGLAWYHGLSPTAATIVGVGLCGGFTTWSTAVWETLALLRLRHRTQAVAYTFGGLALAVGVAAVGIVIAAIT